MQDSATERDAFAPAQIVAAKPIRAMRSQRL